MRNRRAGLPSSANMTFRQLEIFHATVTSRSVTAAAHVLNVSQPSLSRSLRRLEDQLGTALFTRNRNRLQPTAEALRLYAEVDGLMRQFETLSGSVGSILEGESALFRFGATASVSRVLVPRAISLLTASAPKLQIFLDAVTADQFIDYVVSGRGECGLTLLDVRHPLIATREIGTAPLIALLHRDHPLANKTALSASDLESEEIIAFEQAGPHSVAIDRFLASLPRRPRERVMVRFTDAAIALARERIGIGLVDAFSADETCLGDLVIKPLVDAPLFTARLCWHRERPISRHVETLATALQACVGRLAGRTKP